MQALLLLAGRQLQVTLERLDTGGRQLALESQDCGLALRNIGRRAQAVAQIADQRFVVAAIEYAEHAGRRQPLPVAPEEVLATFFFARRLEAVRRQPQRVQATQHAADHAVLAGAVRPLQHEQQGVAAVGPEHGLLHP